ncbi:alpha/beta hydrolase family protein [Chitinophagaceae bacterium MMS25-I14]
MNKHLTALLLTLSGTTALHAQDKLTGDWQGTMNVGKPLRLVFHITSSGNKYSGTMDSPDQGAKGIPCAAITRTGGDSVLFDMSNIGIQYTGAINGKDTIYGSWHQSGMDIPFTLVKTDKPAELKRPQTPQPPFSYNTEEVSYNSKDKTIRFGGTFTTPKGKGPYPAVLLITGSGAQNRDEEIMGHKPFAVIADYLTKHGYAVLRVDDRGIGKTTGSMQDATTADFAADAEAGLDYLKTRKDVDSKKLGMLGHSEGAIIAPMVAARRKDVDFIIMLGGAGVKLTEGMQLQNEAVLKSQGIPADAASEYGQLYLAVSNAAVNAKDSADARSHITAAITAWRKKTAPSVLKVLHLENDETETSLAQSFMELYNIKWFRYFLAIDPQQYLKNVHCKVLALNGDKDLQVISGPNLEGIRQVMVKNTVKTFEIKEMKGLNHLFQDCQTCTLDEYGSLEETFSPAALLAIGEWMDSHVK